MQSIKDEDYEPPQHGGGQCLTASCYRNGTCPAGFCECLGDYTGSYCQLYRPGKKSISSISKDMRQKAGVQKKATSPAQDIIDRNKGVSAERKLVDADNNQSLNANNDGNNQHSNKDNGEGVKAKVKAKAKVKTKVKAKAKATESTMNNTIEMEIGVNAEQPSKQPPTPKKKELNAAEKVEAELDRLYGSNGVFPEPYLAGKIPREMAAPRASKRVNDEKFVYAVRF